MLHLTSGSALVVEFGLAVFCFIDALITPEAAVRWIPRWGWVLFVLAFPVCGTILWIAAGRSWRTRIRSVYLVPRPNPTASTASAASANRHEQIDHASVDPELAGQLQRVDAEHARTLELWEADLRRREQELRAAAEGRDAA